MYGWRDFGDSVVIAGVRQDVHSVQKKRCCCDPRLVRDRLEDSESRGSHVWRRKRVTSRTTMRGRDRAFGSVSKLLTAGIPY